MPLKNPMEFVKRQETVKPFFTRASRIYRRDSNKNSTEILKELTGDDFLLTTSYVLAQPHEFGFTCKKCGSIATIISVDFTRRGKTVIFFFLECPDCNTRGFRKISILKPFPDKQITIDYKARKILYHDKTKLSGTRAFKVTGLDAEAK